MPRPPKSRNPLSQWWNAHQDNDISEQIQENTRRLIDELSSVDFIHSGLSADVLNDRRDESEHPDICSLDWNTRVLIQTLQRDSQQITMDIRPIDEKLMTLVLMFKQFVAYGDVKAATEALSALIIGICDIRCKLPLYQPELTEAFVKENEKYLDSWITLTKLAQRYDRTAQQLEFQKAALQKARDKQSTQLATTEHRIRTEPDFANAFFDIADNKLPEDSTKLSPIQSEVRNLMLAAKVNDNDCTLHTLRCTALTTELNSLEIYICNLSTKLSHPPIVSDPTLMNKYQEAMEQHTQNQPAVEPQKEARPSAWEQIAPGYPDFDDLPENVKAKIILAAREILDEHQSFHDREQEVNEMSIEELCNDLFDEDSLAQLKNFRPTGNKEA